MASNYDFSGWATKNNLKCSDGRIIGSDAFKNCDGKTVPLVWNHQHNDPANVLGHALLENKSDEGVYAYCTFNNSSLGQHAKELVVHGDITSLSIYANQLKHEGSTVKHGVIREVSLVLAGANPGAFIDSVIRHGEESDEEGVIFTDETIELFHADEKPSEEKKADEKEETVEDVLNSLNPHQREVVEGLVAQVAMDVLDAYENDEEDSEDDEKKGEESMKHNVFETEENKEETLVHAEDLELVLKDANRYGSLRESALAHGITDIDYLFPEAKTVTPTPDYIKREMGWVSKFMSGVHHTPFSRIKSVFANITADEARARGYVKGNEKVDEVIGLLKRTTTPQTVYKHQSLDRDDVIDITDFDVVAWLKAEMRMMLDEEIARACLIGDGRSSSSNDKINPINIRPIWQDNALYTISYVIPSTGDRVKDFIKGCVRARKGYKGSGNPTLWTTEEMITECLLVEDTTGRRIYDTMEKLATALRVKEIVPVEVMEGATRTNSSGKVNDLLGLIFNPADYNIGADKGGSVNMFDDFDIDYNKQKYLIETRCSGALTKPYSAIAIEFDTNTAPAAG